MDKKPLIDKFEINVAAYFKVSGFKTGRASHICRVIVSNNSHDLLKQAMERLRLAFPPDDFELSIYGIPNESRYPINEEDLVHDGFGYP